MTVLLRRSWIAPLFLVGLALPALADDKPALKWKLDKDREFFQDMSSNTEQEMTVAGSKITNKQKQNFIFSYKVLDVDKDGNIVVRQKIEGVKMDIEISGSPKISYDSTKTDAGTSPLGEFFKVLVGTEFKLTLGKDLKVTKVEGRDDFIKKLGGTNPQMEPLLKQILSEEALKEMAEPIFGSVPNGDVPDSKTWERPSKFDMGPIGSYENKYKYTYEGKDKDNAKLDRIKVATEVKYVKPKDDAVSGGLPFKIKEATITPKKADGFILFNPEAGRIEASEANLELAGNLKIEIGGQTSSVDMTQKQQTTVKTTDANPIKK
jgi:hypothetical protein